jgi:hypothetical protein
VRSAVDLVAKHAGERVGAQLAATRPVHGELVLEPVPEAVDVALPDARAAALAQRVRVGVPAVEVADDADALGVGGPDAEADADERGRSELRLALSRIGTAIWCPRL